jgi:hypothetical protein
VNFAEQDEEWRHGEAVFLMPEFGELLWTINQNGRFPLTDTDAD